MSKLTARYFRVQSGPDCTTQFGDALKAVAELPLASRRKELGGIHMRLEKVEAAGGLIKGDVTRILKDDFPAEVKSEELAELEVNELGTCCAFVFDPKIDVLVMQYDAKRVSPARLAAYLMLFEAGYSYLLDVIPDKEAWERFASGTVRKLRVRLAAPKDFSFLSENPLGENLSGLAKAYEAPSILIEIGMGHHKGSLLDKVKQHLSDMLGSGDKVRAVTAKTEEEQDEFSLLKEVIDFKDDRELSPSPAKNSRQRITFVTQAYNEQKAYLIQMYGSKGGTT